MSRLHWAGVMVLFWGAQALGEQAHHMLWEVKGKHNTVYFLGSIHMLKPDDAVLPGEALRDYANSKTLVMELDLNDVSTDLAAGPSAALEMLPPQQSLAGIVGAPLFAKLQARAQPLGLEADALNRFQPWFAAMMLEQLQLASSGFDASSGVDMQFAQMAQSDQKPIIGLETVEEQLGIFAHLPMDQQREYLRSTLEDSDANDAETAQVIHAWQAGDTPQLERLLREDAAQSPELFRKLTVERNKKWLSRIDQFLNDDTNYLVIVGAMHLIGDDGVIDLLRRQGYTPVQH